MNLQNFKSTAKKNIDEIDEKISVLRNTIEYNFNGDYFQLQLELNECELKKDDLIRKYYKFTVSKNSEYEKQVRSFKSSQDLLKDKLLRIEDSIFYDS